jgi:chemotaxis protein histidine kinase CheA
VKLALQIARELHTLKGEATMLNFLALGDLVHAAEETLANAGADDARRTTAARRVLEALAAVQAWLRDDVGPPERADAALTAARDRLRGGAPAAGGEPGVAAPVEPPDRARPQERWVQVNARRIDDLSEQVSVFEGEFGALYARLREHARKTAAEGGHTRDLRGILVDLDRCDAKLRDITSAAWALRLVPVEPALAELAGYARGLASAQGKNVQVVVSAGNAQIERTVIETLEEPLVHLVRNAIDHGVEPPAARGPKGEARVSITAQAIGPDVVLAVADDGHGIDLEAVRKQAVARGLLDRSAAAALSDDDALDLLFVHGFSTREAVTELSGRGVGLDVVRSSVEAVGGSVRVTSALGVGTQFHLTVPTSISKEKALVLDVGGHLYAIPSRSVSAVVRLEDGVVEAVAGGSVFRLGDEAIPLRSLSTALGVARAPEEEWAAIVDASRHRWAFSTTKPIGDFALLRRPIDRVVGSAAPIGASATFEDGRLVLILALGDLVRRSPTPAASRAERPASRVTRVLVVDDSAVVRELMTEILGYAGFEVRVATGGEQALASLAEDKPDVVVLDIDMPKMDGFEVLRRIRLQSEVPVIMLTLRASAEDQRRATSLGASAYVVKSHFQETTLIETIRRFSGTGR